MESRKAKYSDLPCVAKRIGFFETENALLVLIDKRIYAIRDDGKSIPVNDLYDWYYVESDLFCINIKRGMNNENQTKKD